MYWTKAFWKGLGERSIKVFFSALGGAFGSDVVGVLDVDWTSALSMSLMAVIINGCFAIGNADFTAGVQNDSAVVKHLRG